MWDSEIFMKGFVYEFVTILENLRHENDGCQDLGKSW